MRKSLALHGKTGNLSRPPYSDLAQHGPAAAIGPPYVYSYHKDDVDALYAAVRSARDNPIDR